MTEQNHTQIQEAAGKSLDTQLNDLACDMAGIEAVLNMLADGEADTSADAIFLIAKQARRINEELGEIANKVAK